MTDRSSRTRRGTATSAFGVGRREAHDASEFYARFTPPELSGDDAVTPFPDLADPFVCGDARAMTVVPDGSVALVVTSPPYFVGKEYEADVLRGEIPHSYEEYLTLLEDVFADCKRVLEPGGRIAVNVANLGRKPYRSLSADVMRILEERLGLLLRGEVVWLKGRGATGSCAWGSFGSPANPVLRDLTERVIVASKGRFDRARTARVRAAEGLPHEATLSKDEFMEATLDVWEIPAESARRVGHPAPFPVELPERLIRLHTYRGDAVLDPFMGSGSTLVAAARTGRRYVGFDLDPAYVEIARARVAEAEAAVDPVDAAHDEAARAGGTAPVLAESVLVEAGFAVVDRNRRVGRLGITIPLVAADARGVEWSFDVTGSFSTVRSGLVRTDVAWRAAGRAGALARAGIGPYVLLSPHLPVRKTEADKALRAMGPEAIFDVIGLVDPSGLSRLATYAAGGCEFPQIGFWVTADLSVDMLTSRVKM